MNSPAIILSAMAWCGMASAATILIDSHQGLFTSFAGVETVAITPHPAWEPNHPTNPGNASDSAAVWISFWLQACLVPPDCFIKVQGGQVRFETLDHQLFEVVRP